MIAAKYVVPSKKGPAWNADATFLLFSVDNFNQKPGGFFSRNCIYYHDYRRSGFISSVYKFYALMKRA
jgi:hypothetical protein